MPFSLEYNKKAKIISIKRVKNALTEAYVIRYKVGKKRFKAYIGCNHLNIESIRTAITSTYEQETRINREEDFKKSLQGKIIEFNYKL